MESFFKNSLMLEQRSGDLYQLKIQASLDFAGL